MLWVLHGAAFPGWRYSDCLQPGQGVSRWKKQVWADALADSASPGTPGTASPTLVQLTD